MKNQPKVREESMRERKRRETKKRITDAGMELFIRHGFDATTLDDIAAEADISRRNFFHYFKSKDEILLSIQNGLGDMMVLALQQQQALHKSPHIALRDAVLAVSNQFEREEMVMLESLMRSNSVTEARRLASYVEHEEKLFLALIEMCPSPARRTGLRMVAMMTMGALRISLDVYAANRDNHNVSDLLIERLDAIIAEMGQLRVHSA